MRRCTSRCSIHYTLFGDVRDCQERPGNGGGTPYMRGAEEEG